jgi:hypothetical protein
MFINIIITIQLFVDGYQSSIKLLNYFNYIQVYNYKNGNKIKYNKYQFVHRRE